MRTLRILWIYTINSFQEQLANKTTAVLFLFAKILRIGLFVIFLTFLFQGTKTILGYTKEQMIFFYLSFHLIDTLGQVLFREVYRFRRLVVSGDLDLVLLKPMSPLVRLMFGGPDLLDFIIFIFMSAVVGWYGMSFISQNPIFWLLYLGLVLNGVVITAAFYIFVLGLGIISTSVDHLVMIYRDMTAMMRVPVDIYIEPLRSMLTFVIPLGVMITFPAKALMGFLSPGLFGLALLCSAIFIYLSFRFWKYSIKQYQSASS